MHSGIRPRAQFGLTQPLGSKQADALHQSRLPYLTHAATAAAPPDLITSDARELILRVSRGIPRLISHLLRISLVLADERGLASIDVSVVNTAAIVLHLESTKPAVVPPPKPRFDRDARSRG